MPKQVDPQAIRAGASVLLGRARGQSGLRASSVVPPTGDTLPTDSLEVVQLLKSEQFREEVSRIAGDAGVPRDEAMIEAAGYLREMSASHNERVTEWWQRF